MSVWEDIDGFNFYSSLKFVDYTVATEEERKTKRNHYKNFVRFRFILHLVYNHTQELIDAGISTEQMKLMALTGRSPESWSCHHKIPIHGGGSNEFRNLILLPKELHIAVHNYIDTFTILAYKPGETHNIPIPMFEGQIYNAKKENIKYTPVTGPLPKVA